MELPSLQPKHGNPPSTNITSSIHWSTPITSSPSVQSTTSDYSVGGTVVGQPKKMVKENNIGLSEKMDED